MNTEQKEILVKVPAVTLGFWVIKILAITLGETGGDAVSMSMNLDYLASTGIFMALFAVAVLLQIKAKRFHPFLYWLPWRSRHFRRPSGACCCALPFHRDFQNDLVLDGFRPNAAVGRRRWRFPGQVYNSRRPGVQSLRGNWCTFGHNRYLDPGVASTSSQ